MALTRKPGRRIVYALVWFFVIAAVYYGGRFLFAEFDELSAPAADQSPIPEGLVIESTERLCGSGGCWTSSELSKDQTSTEALAELWSLNGTCQTVSLLDLRKVCADVSDQGETVQVELYYMRYLDL